MSKYFDQKGIAHLLLLIAAIGVIGFILISSSAQFKNKLFSNLFPKIPSQAESVASPTPSPTPTVAVIELEDPLSIPEIDKVVAREFYKTHGDNFDFLAIFFDFNRRHWYHSTAQNKVQGIGSQNWVLVDLIPKLDENPIFDQTAEWGSKGKLLGVGVNGPVADYTTIAGPTAVYSILLHEVIGHQFGVYIGKAQGSSDPLPVQNSTSFGHWSNCVTMVRADPTQPYMWISDWKDNGDGTWTRMDREDFSKLYKFDPLMQYFMGMIPSEKATNLILLEPEGGFKRGICSPGVTIKATPRQISVNDVIARYGPRVPSFNDSQKEFSTAFILVVEKGRPPTPGVVEKMQEWAAKYPDVIRQATTPNVVACTPCTADVSKNGKVDIVDFSSFRACQGKALTDTDAAGRSCSNSDVNKDGKIDNLDLQCIQSQFGKTCSL